MSTAVPSVVALDLLQQPQQVQEQVDNVLQDRAADTQHKMKQSQATAQSQDGSPQCCSHWTVCFRGWQ